ncbi:dnaJ homolog subfamily C member 14 [Carettochelys insculpta]|uniref:dnaJ homolog subfamily C member 14 n=1 Tax=Carettochelys insculpta TaxID=44489 RepID=UPI003EBAC881
MEAHWLAFAVGGTPRAHGHLPVDPSAERPVEAEEAGRSAPLGSADGDGHWPGRAAEEDVGWAGSCDQTPTALLEEHSLHVAGYSAPGPCAASFARSCSCRGESLDLSRTYLEKGNSSCSATCQRWASESPGVEDGPDSGLLPQGLEEEEEEEDGVSKASDDPLESGRVLGGRKSGRRQRCRSGVKDKEEGKENCRREGRAAPAGRKHKQARKRSHVDQRCHLKADVPKQLEELAWLCFSCFKKLIQLVLDLTHVCGEYVEAGGRLLYICCQRSAWDLGSPQDCLRTWSQWAKAGSGKAAQWLCSWGSRLLRLLGALLLLVLLVLLGSLRLGWQVSRSLLLAGVGKLGSTSSMAWLRWLLDSPFPRRAWAAFRETRTCQYVARLLHTGRELLGTPRGPGEAAPGPEPPAGRGHQPNQEVARLLALADVPEEELNPFQVLGLEATASDLELKKAYRQLAVLVHPDKNEHPRAEEAFKVLRAAWDVVSSPEKRQEYECKRAAESELSRSMTELLTRLRDDLKEAMNTMMCSKCQGKHKRFEMDRDPLSARYCRECDTLHPAEEGDLWAESSMLGLKITYFALMDGKVYDITGPPPTAALPRLQTCRTSSAASFRGPRGRHPMVAASARPARHRLGLLQPLRRRAQPPAGTRSRNGGRRCAAPSSAEQRRGRVALGLARQEAPSTKQRAVGVPGTAASTKRAPVKKNLSSLQWSESPAGVWGAAGRSRVSDTKELQRGRPAGSPRHQPSWTEPWNLFRVTLEIRDCLVSSWEPRGGSQVPSVHLPPFLTLSSLAALRLAAVTC